MRILLTGIAGFIGHWVAQELVARGDVVVGVDNFNDYYDPAFKRARAARLKGPAKIYEADVSDYERMKQIADENKIERVCHMAAQAGVRYSLENPFAYEKANVLGTLSLLELCRRAKIPSMVYASSSSVYGGNEKIPFSETDPVDRPVSLYAATKKSNELMAYAYHHLYGIRLTGLRFFTVYGPWGRPDMAYFKFTQAIEKGKPIDVYNFGKMRRDFTYITDIVQGVLSALDKDYPFEIFNLGNSQSIELPYFIRRLENELGKKAVINLLPIQPGDVPDTFADIAHSKKMLGFEPKIKIEEGLAEFVRWYKEYFKVR